MRTLFGPLLIGLLFFACGEKDGSTRVDITAGRWEFAMSNLVSGPGEQSPFKPADLLMVHEDSLVVTNYLVNDGERGFRLISPGTSPDSLTGFTARPGVGTSLLISGYQGDSLTGEWVFERPQTAYQPLPFGALTGKSYYCVLPAQDTTWLYFDECTNVRFSRNRDKLTEYYVVHTDNYQEETSRPLPDNPGNAFNSHFALNPMRGYFFHYWNIGSAFQRHRYVYGRAEDGRIMLTWFDEVDGRYQRMETELVPVAPLVATEKTAEDFAEQINVSTLMIDTSYPDVDSADVSYNYEEDYYRWGGLEFDELAELEITFDPGGDMILFVRDRVVVSEGWRLSSDKSHLIINRDRTYLSAHYPIMKWTDDRIDLRMPLKVKTRRPRGVKLESYTVLDAYLSFRRDAAATSSR